MPIGQFVKELRAALARKDGYIMGATGQNPKKWATSSWWFTQYSGSQKTKALYWREHAQRVWDCNGLAEGIYKDFSGVDINARARNNYTSWCSVKGTGVIPGNQRIAGAAVFWGSSASSIHHVAYLDAPVDAKKPEGDWYLIEARGVNYGVVRTRMNSRKPNYWGLMDKYFDYGNTAASSPVYVTGERTIKRGSTGDDVRDLQVYLDKLGYDVGKYGFDGEFGRATESAVKAYQMAKKLTADGVVGKKTWATLKEDISALTEGNDSAENVQTPIGNLMVKSGTWNIRTGPGTNYSVAASAHTGDKLVKVDIDGWIPVLVDGQVRWISEKASK